MLDRTTKTTCHCMVKAGFIILSLFYFMPQDFFLCRLNLIIIEIKLLSFHCALSTMIKSLKIDSNTAFILWQFDHCIKVYDFMGINWWHINAFHFYIAFEAHARLFSVL